jgi:hypothetical protein
MDAQTFKDKFGIAECEAVAAAAKTNYAYFHQIATGHRRPSVELAQALVEASGGRLDLVALLTAKTAVA